MEEISAFLPPLGLEEIILATLLILSLFLLVLVGRMNARNRKVERWLAQEFSQIRAELSSLRQTAPGAPQGVLPRPASPPPQPARLSRNPLQAKSVDLLAAVNELLAGSQPYNLMETIGAMHPQLELRRITPRSDRAMWARETVLEFGGDGLFAAISGEVALLFPNYGRFSATLDPAPLFDGARHGGRIHSVLRPASLKRAEGETWVLREKGRVQMRQGEN